VISRISRCVLGDNRTARGGGGHAPAMLQFAHPLLDGGHETPGPTCADALPISSVRAARAKNIFNMKLLLPRFL
jgi:hypothetical protein